MDTNLLYTYQNLKTKKIQIWEKSQIYLEIKNFEK